MVQNLTELALIYFWNSKSGTDQKVFLAGWTEQVQVLTCCRTGSSFSSLISSYLVSFALQNCFLSTFFFFNLAWSVWSKLVALVRAKGSPLKFYVVGIRLQVTGEAWVLVCVFNNGIVFSVCSLEAKSLSYVLLKTHWTNTFHGLKLSAKETKPASK